MIHIDKYIITQILGSLMHKPAILDLVDKYRLSVEDFSSPLDRYCFSAIYNLYVNGMQSITEIDVDNYLKATPSIHVIFEKEKGVEYLQDALDLANDGNFNYYYNKLKKINLLNDLSTKIGCKTDEIYCEDILNPRQKEINEKFETLTIQEIIKMVKGKVVNVEANYALDSDITTRKVTDGASDLLKKLMMSPEIGHPLQGSIYNTVVRGARKGKMYLQSSPSNTGKTRIMLGNAAYLAYPLRYELATQQWVSTGSCEKVLYIASEQDLDEFQTMLWSYLTGINEDQYTYGLLTDEERERTEIAIEIMEHYKDNLLFVKLADPSVAQVKTVIRQSVLNNDVETVFYDYIFSSPSLLGEFRDIKIREDVALMLLSTALKDLAVELNIFLMTCTQTSGDLDQEEGIKGYKYIRGAKSIADKCDIGQVMTRVSKKELEALKPLCNQYGCQPNLVTDIYKVRRGRWIDVRIWSRVDLGTCRREDLFITDANYKSLQNFKVFDFSNDYTPDQINYVNELNSRLTNQNKMIEFNSLEDIQAAANQESERKGGIGEGKVHYSIDEWDI